jgi:predicted DNA-binding transcriptional regulator AlpA
MATTVEQEPLRMAPSGLVRNREAARYLGVAVKTLDIWRSRGEGPAFIKLGHIFYFKQDLDAWLQRAARVRSTAEARLHQQQYGMEEREEDPD